MWKTVKLGDVLKTGAGGTPLKSKKNYYEGGNIKWLLSGAVCEKEINDSKTHITEDGLSNSSAKLFPKNTVLIAMYGATAGQVGILRTEAATNQAVCGIYPSKDYLPEFLYYYLTNYKKTLLLEVSGVAQPNLSQVKIKNIPLPCITLEEQHRIVAKLDAAFAEIDETIEIERKKLKQAESLLENLIREKSLSAMKQYGSKPLAELCELQNGFAFKSTKFRDDGIPVLRISNIQEGSITTDKLVYASQDDYSENLEKYIVKKEALLIAMSGATTGKVGINKSEKTFYLNQRVGMLTPKETLDRDFLYFFLTTKVEELLSISAGAAQPNLSTKQIKEIRLPNASLVQQRNLSSDLIKLNTEIDSLLSICKIKLRNLASLKLAILSQELRTIDGEAA